MGTKGTEGDSDCDLLSKALHLLSFSSHIVFGSKTKNVLMFSFHSKLLNCKFLITDNICFGCGTPWFHCHGDMAF